MTTTWERLRDVLRTNLWPIPTLAVLVALAAGLLLPHLDARLDGGSSDLVFGGGADAARTVLSAVASSLMTVTSLTFSLTVVTLQLASSQFSPRLLRTFTRDLVVQGTLGLFLGTFTFALTVLRTVRTETGGEIAFVPRFSVTLAYVLAVASVLALVFFLAHLTRMIRVESMLRSVHQDATAAASRHRDDERLTPRAALDLVPGHAVLLIATSSGFLVDVDERALVDVTTQHDLVVLVERDPGESVVEGTPIGWVWSATGAGIGDEVVRAVQDLVSLGFERTGATDVSLGLRQLVDVAVKALSPGINDPTTAVHVLGHVSSFLCGLGTAPLGPRVVRDRDGALRGVLSQPSFGDLLALAVEQPAHYGSTDPQVLGRLLMMLREVAWTGGRHSAGAVAVQLERLNRLLVTTELDPVDRAALEVEVAAVVAAIDGRWDQTRHAR